MSATALPFLMFQGRAEEAMNLYAALFDDGTIEAELDRLPAGLGEEVLMPPDNYGFSRKFAWVSDRFGISWQLNLA